MLFAEQERYKESIPYLKAAVEAQPTYSDLHYQLALAYEKSGEKKLAIEHYEEALRFVPDSQDALDSLKRLGQ